MKLKYYYIIKLLIVKSLVFNLLLENKQNYFWSKTKFSNPHLLLLMKAAVEGSDYINASFFDVSNKYLFLMHQYGAFWFSVKRKRIKESKVLSSISFGDGSFLLLLIPYAPLEVFRREGRALTGMKVLEGSYGILSNHS